MGRSHELELLDQGISRTDPKTYRDCLRQLGRIGRLFGANDATLSYMPPHARSFLDVGCGGGEFARAVARRFPQAQVVGIDTDPEAIRYAQEQSSPNARFEQCASDTMGYCENSFDVVTATLVCHHLTDDDIVKFLLNAYQVARHAVVINDLHRCRLASMLFLVTAPILFPNRLILHDGLLSIRRAFVRADWERFMLKAGFAPHQWSLTWHWAFRWLLVIRKPNDP